MIGYKVLVKLQAQDFLYFERQQRECCDPKIRLFVVTFLPIRGCNKVIEKNYKTHLSK